VRLHIQIDPELRKKLDAHCRETGTTKRDAVEAALRGYLAG
jgi:hypothetical protein